MNLVAKEYVASQDPEDPGVLILSRFAGAAVECEAALLVNPYDPESVGSAAAQALSMPLDERRRRHDALFQVLITGILRSTVVGLNRASRADLRGGPRSHTHDDNK
jgi:trehalose 6-phosphate synthase